MLAGFSAVLLVKGVFAVMVPVVCALWLVSRWRANEPSVSSRGAWGGNPRRMPLAAVGLAWAYELADVRATGQSFLDVYQSRQIPEDSIAGQSPVVRTLYTATWDVTRVVWYSFPWSVVAAVFAAGTAEARRMAALAGAGRRRGQGRHAAWFAHRVGYAPDRVLFTGPPQGRPLHLPGGLF